MPTGSGFYIYRSVVFTRDSRNCYSSDATILVFGIRYDIDTILPTYRDIDTISIFYKQVKIVCSICHTGGGVGIGCHVASLRTAQLMLSAGVNCC